MDLTESIFVGVCSGIIASILLSICYIVFIRIVIPWYQSVVYRGIDIKGDWSGSRIDGEMKYNVELTFKQNGHKLSGTFVAIDEFPDTIKTKQFKIKGEIYNNCVLVTYESNSKKNLGSGSFLFQLYESGNTLKGAMSYLRTKTGDIGAKDDILLNRKV